MIAWRLALRNLFRNPRRSILSIVAVVAGIGVFVLGDGFISGIEEGIVAAAIEGTTGHVLARPAGYPAAGLQHPVDALLQLDPATLNLLDREAVAWTERLLFAPIAASGEDFQRVRAIGYDPERDPTVFPRRLWTIEGAQPAPEQDEILVSPGVASLLRLSPGDRLILQVRTHRGAINALEVQVSGIATTNNMALDINGVLAPLPLARRLVDAQAPSHLAVRLSSRDNADSFQRRLAAALGPQAEVITWQEDTGDLLALMRLRRRALEFIVLVLLALAGFGMANTILMAAHERVREIGTLRSLGMTEGQVIGLFVLEGFAMGLIGSLLGILWGGSLVAWWAAHPIDFSEQFTQIGVNNMAFSALVYTRFSTATLATGAGFGVLVAALASIYPARVASRIPPAEALRAT